MSNGWKTITGAILIAVGQALEPFEEPLHTIGRFATFFGTILTGVGARLALTKAAEHIRKMG